MKLRCATCQVGLEESWTIFGRFMKVVEHFGNIDWNAHELVTWNLDEIEFALLWSHLTKGVYYKRLNGYTNFQRYIWLSITNK
jgi:hypothetical protein